MLTFGIDPGQTGAIACLRADGTCVDVEDMPVMRYRKTKTKLVDPKEFLSMIRKMRGDQPSRAVIEHVRPIPQRRGDGEEARVGSFSTSSKSMFLASALSVLILSGCVIDELVEPAVWKRHCGLLMPGATDREKKLASLKCARKLFPRAPLERFADNGRAEALLIAYYALHLPKLIPEKPAEASRVDMEWAF